MTQFIETNLLLAVMSEDFEAAEAEVRKLSPTERVRLAEHVETMLELLEVDE